MKKLNLCNLIITLLLLNNSLHSQDWIEKMQDGKTNFYDVQKQFYKDQQQRQARIEKDKDESGNLQEEEGGFLQFKRWENFMAPRVYPTGNRFNPSIVADEYQKYISNMSTNKVAMAGNWSLIGPVSTVPTSGGSGRLNFVRVDPKNVNNLFVGSPGGGLWTSKDGGATWATNTDKLGVLGATDIAIDPNNSSIMYLATGDGDGSDTYSQGVLKSTDGGTTWIATGLNWTNAQARSISKLLIDPTNTSILLAATNNGIYRSTDAAATWTQVQAGGFKDMEFKPGDPTVVYAAGTGFYRSSNNGTSFTAVTSGLPASSAVSRLAIAVTVADPNYVYVVASKPAPSYGYQGIYLSTNGGTSFTSKSTSPNLLGWVTAGSDADGQGWYTLSIAASPTNKAEVVVGGVNIWRSTDSGTNWTINAHWTGSGAPYVHADIHDLVYLNGTSTYFSACDGGLFKTTSGGSSWSDLSKGLQIAEAYGLGMSTTNAALTFSGWQDNGTVKQSGTAWSRVLGGDGMKCFIDWSNDQYMFGEQYNGSLQMSSNGGGSFSAITSGITETGGWVTPWMQDPTTAATIYAGFVNIWKSTNRGSSWSKISAFTSTTSIVQLAVAPSDSKYIYATTGTALYKTANGGTSWTTINSNLPGGSITYIAVSSSDPNRVWVTFSGFSNSTKVFETRNGGTTWINRSASLPNIPVNCVVYQKNSKDAIYIGTDLGVYYRDSTLNVWQPFFNGLPNVEIFQLEIHYGSNKLRAATYGRGLWESGLYTPGAYAPVANFSSSSAIGCSGLTVQFNDQSSGPPTSWNWSFPGGNPSTSTLQNPVIVYGTPGTYSVSLTSNNANGNDTKTINSFVVVNSSPLSAPTTTGGVIPAPGVVGLSATGAGSAILQWYDAPTGGNLVNTGTTYSPSITVPTTFYVQQTLPPAPDSQVGPVDNTIGTGANFVANDLRGMYFDVINPIKLKKVTVVANVAGNRTFEIVNNFGTLMDTTLNVPAGKSDVTLNFNIYPGSQYLIKMRGLVDLYRNDAGATFPYTKPDVSITGSNGSPGYYYYFYNWITQAIPCSSPRTPVLGNIVTGIAKNLAKNNTLKIMPNPNNGKFDLYFEIADKDNLNIEITDALGQIVYKEILKDFSGTYFKAIELNAVSKGIYFIRVKNSVGEINKKMLSL